MTTTVLTDENRRTVARAIWSIRREEEDRCDMELEDMPPSHSVWAEADAAIGAIEQAVLQSPEVQARQWQPIETAPKDFVTEFDGWNGERVPNVIWAHPEYEAKGEYAWCRSFYEHNHGWTMERVQGLTHWMPLPAPPADAAMEKQT